MAPSDFTTSAADFTTQEFIIACFARSMIGAKPHRWIVGMIRKTTNVKPSAMPPMKLTSVKPENIRQSRSLTLLNPPENVGKTKICRHFICACGRNSGKTMGTN